MVFAEPGERWNPRRGSLAGIGTSEVILQIKEGKRKTDSYLLRPQAPVWVTNHTKCSLPEASASCEKEQDRGGEGMDLRANKQMTHLISKSNLWKRPQPSKTVI